CKASHVRENRFDLLFAKLRFEARHKWRFSFRDRSLQLFVGFFTMKVWIGKIRYIAHIWPCRMAIESVAACATLIVDVYCTIRVIPYRAPCSTAAYKKNCSN